MTEFPNEMEVFFHSDSEDICVCVCVCVCTPQTLCQHGAPHREGEVPFQEYFFGFYDNVHITFSVEL